MQQLKDNPNDGVKDRSNNNRLNGKKSTTFIGDVDSFPHPDSNKSTSRHQFYNEHFKLYHVLFFSSNDTL